MEIHLNLLYYYYNVECIIALGGSEWLGLTTNEELRKKLVLMCKFQREFKFGTEDKKWR